MTSRMQTIIHVVGFMVVFAGGVLLSGCSQESNGHSPTAPTASALGNYAQMPGCPTCSTTATVNGETHQINLAFSDQPMYPYGVWFYAELNEQRGRGKQPGEEQTAVNLSNVVFTFTGLPGEITTLLAAIKTSPHPPLSVDSTIPLSSCPNPGQDQDGTFRYCQFAVQNGVVAIPAANADLSRFFGETHFSLWFQAVGGQNGQGPRCGGWLEVRGTLPDGQTVTLGNAVCFGSNPAAVPTPVPFLTAVVTGTATDLQNLYGFQVTEPDASQANIYYDGATWQTANGTKSTATTPVTPATQLQIAIAPDPALTGTYTVTISNDAIDWAGIGGCPGTPPMTFTLTLTTNAGVKTCTCTALACVNDSRIDLDVTFPAGTSTIKPTSIVPPPCTCL